MATGAAAALESGSGRPADAAVVLTAHPLCDVAELKMITAFSPLYHVILFEIFKHSIALFSSKK